MVQRIYLSIAGCANDWPTGPLTHDAAKEAVVLAHDIQKTGHVPAAIFTDGVLSAVQQAHIMGGVLGVFNIVEDPRLVYRYPKGTFVGDEPDPFRNNCRTSAIATRFMRKACPLKKSDETILLVTDRCWGLTFGGSWPRGALSCFDLPSQKLNFVAYYGGGM